MLSVSVLPWESLHLFFWPSAADGVVVADADYWHTGFKDVRDVSWVDMINERFWWRCDPGWRANSLREVKKREYVRPRFVGFFDRSILKSPIKIISLDSSQTTSIIDTNLSVQFAGSEGFRYRNPTRNGEVFCSLTSSQIHSTPYFSNSVRRVTDIVSWTYTTRPVSLWICGSLLITWNPSIAVFIIIIIMDISMAHDP